MKTNKLPDKVVKIDDFKYFFKLKDGKNKWCKENLELNDGLIYYIKSARDKDTYYKRVSYNSQDMDINLKNSIFIRDWISRGWCWMSEESYETSINEYNKAKHDVNKN